MKQTYAIEFRKKHWELQYGNSNLPEFLPPIHQGVSQENMPDFMSIMNDPKIMSFMLGKNDNEKEAFEVFEQFVLQHPDLLNDFHKNIIEESEEYVALNEYTERLNAHFLSAFQYQKIYQDLLGACYRYPNFIPLHLLASENQPIDYQPIAFQMARSGVFIGLNALQQAGFDWQKDTLSWDNVNNRPFMRVYYSYIIHLIQQNETEEAIYHAERLLKVWHNDNLGTRFELIYAYIRAKLPNKALLLYKKYSGDSSAEMLLGRALAAFQNKHKEQNDFLQAAIETYPLIAKELCKKKHRRPTGWYGGLFLPNTPEHAFVYWEEFGQFWLECEGALAWVENQLPAKLKPKSGKGKTLE